MIDQIAAPYVLLAALGAVLLLRDLRSLKNLDGFFDAVDELLAAPDHGAALADDIAQMSRSLLSPRLARQMAWFAARGVLARELREPGPRARAFAARWRSQGEEHPSRRPEVLRRFVWEMTRTSLVFGSVFGAWLLWRGAAHWGADAERDWAVLAGVGTGVRASERT